MLIGEVSTGGTSPGSSFMEALLQRCLLTVLPRLREAPVRSVYERGELPDEEWTSVCHKARSVRTPRSPILCQTSVPLTFLVLCMVASPSLHSPSC